MKMKNKYKTILILGSLAFLSLQEIKAETACCGDQIYNPPEEECCGGTTVVPKGRCCDGSEMEEGEECCNNQAYSDPWVCCDDTAINPTETTTLSKSLDFTEIGKAIQGVTKKIVDVTGLGCSPKMSGPIQLAVEWKTHEECCEDEITKLSAISGTARIESFAFKCQATPTAAILPAYVGGITFSATFALRASISLTGQQTCEIMDVCSSITPSGYLEGKVEAYVGQDGYQLVSVSGFARGSATGSMKYCVDSGVKIEELCFEPSLHATIKVALVWEPVRWSHSYGSVCL